MITFTAPDDTTEYDIPVTVTYPDGSHDTATAKVFVNKTVDPTHVDPTNPEYKDMFKKVTRDIVTTPVSGQQTTDTQSLDFGRSMTIYGNGQASTYGKWEAGKLGADGKSFAIEGGSTEFALKDIPQADGYTSYYKIGSDGQKVIATAVPSTSALDQDSNPVNGTTVYVGYDENEILIPTPTEGKVVINYADKNNPSHILGITSVGGINGSEVNVSSVIKNNVPANWKIDPAYTIPTNSVVPDTINVPLIHATRTITPTDHDDADMFKTVTRTIKVNNPDGTVNTTTQKVNFNRTKTIDEVTNKVISYGNWTLATGSAKDWDQFVIPQLSGFTSYIGGSAAKEVAEEDVTADTTDVTVEVTYKNSGNHGDNTKPDNVPNPSDHNNPNFENNNHGNNHPNKRNNDSNNVSNDIDQNGNRSLNTNPTAKSNRSNGVNAKTTYNNHGENGQKNKRALPQTGNNKDEAVVAGLGLASLLAMLGLGDLNKRRN